MMPSVLVNLDNFKKGSLVTVPGLGGFKNGETTDVSQVKFDRFASRSNVGHMIVDDKVVVTNKTLRGETADKPKKKSSKSTDDVKPEEDSSD